MAVCAGAVMNSVTGRQGCSYAYVGPFRVGIPEAKVWINLGRHVLQGKVNSSHFTGTLAGSLENDLYNTTAKNTSKDNKIMSEDDTRIQRRMRGCSSWLALEAPHASCSKSPSEISFSVDVLGDCSMSLW